MILRGGRLDRKTSGAKSGQRKADRDVRSPHRSSVVCKGGFLPQFILLSLMKQKMQYMKSGHEFTGYLLFEFDNIFPVLCS